MRYRKLGNTGLSVSELGFGTIPILSGNVPVLPDYYSPDEETAIAIMMHAWSLGCNLFDTAIVPEYGDAEIKLGKFAAAAGREKLIISDKARYFTGNEMYNAVLSSCENLKTYPDIYFVHQVDEDNADIVFGNNGAVEALVQLQSEGKIKYIGIASHYYSVLYRGACDPRIDVLQGSGNIMERGMLDRIERETTFLKKGLLINKVYAAGILPSFFSIEMLISGVLSYPVSSALIGIGTTEQADDVLRMKKASYERPDFSFVRLVLEKSFNMIPCDRCQKCRCCYGTEIHILFRQYNYFYMGKDYWALRKLDLSIEESAVKCRQCTEMPCLKQCPRGLRIPELIGNIHELTKIHIRHSKI